MSPQVLVVSRDQMLVQTRQWILGTLFRVEGAGRVREAEVLISRRRFDLIVLCYTLSEDECKRMFDLIERQKPLPKVLILTAAGSKPVGCIPESALTIEAGPHELLKKAAEIFGIDLKEKAKLVAV